MSAIGFCGGLFESAGNSAFLHAVSSPADSRGCCLRPVFIGREFSHQQVSDGDIAFMVLTHFLEIF
jgi:hypothetical protein